jgi:hypothetical protein
MSEDTFRLPESELYGCWLVNTADVNMGDLKDIRPGRVIRVRDQDAIRYIPGLNEPYEHVAGMVSDAA